ncbi:MAG: glycosyltransferase [Clostridia bacterium]|nr:glycosyltransferase [Clostridia bacterium]
MAKTRILFLIPNLMHGGAEKVLVNLVNNLDSEKFDITLQTVFDVGVHKKSVSPHVKYKSVFKRMFRGNSVIMKLFSPKMLYNLFVKEKYDIAVAYLEGPAARIISGCNDKDTKKICVIHTEQKTSIGFKSPDEARACYDAFDTIVFVSETVKDTFVKSMNVTKPSLTVKYNVNEVEQILESSKQSVDDVKFDENSVNLISTGKIIKVKGFDRLARVHKRLIDEGKKHNIYILGVGEEQENIQKYISENSLDNSFKFLGYRDNPYKYVAKADAYVCSSYKEGFSTAVTEALVVGTPVVTTLCSGMEELLGKNDEYGLIVENSEDGLYSGMKKMIESAQLRAHYAQKVKERAKVFSKENTVRAYEKLFEELVKQ